MTPICLCETTQTEGFINLRNHSQNHIEEFLKRKKSQNPNQRFVSKSRIRQTLSIVQFLVLKGTKVSVSVFGGGGFV
jgi:hypothetical protein